MKFMFVELGYFLVKVNQIVAVHQFQPISWNGYNKKAYPKKQ